MNFNLSIDISRKPEDIFPWAVNPDKAMLWHDTGDCNEKK